MRKIIGSVFSSLDGVVQAPGGPTEDPTGEFPYGGWLPPYADDVTGKTIGALFERPFDLLLGRRTYDIFAAFWPYVEGDEKPLGETFDRVRKYVLTRSTKPLSWQHSEPLSTIDAVATLKEGNGPDLLIQGSSTLYPQLLAAGLLDRLTVLTYPVVLGRGKRLFGDGTHGRTMRMIDHTVSPNGTIVATYEPGGSVELGSYVGSAPSPAEVARQTAMSNGSW